MAVVRYTKRAIISSLEVPRFPLILTDSHDVHFLSLNFFLDLRLQGTAVSSIGTYGTHLVDFISQMEVDGLEIGEIDDEWFEAYKNSILCRGDGEKRNSTNYASQLLRTVIMFMYWLETNEYIRDVVGEKRESAVRIVVKDRGISHWLVKNKKSQAVSISSPKLDWIKKIKPYGPKRVDLSERFELMIDWGVTLGLRVMEICNFTIPQLPDLESARKYIADNELFYIPVLVNKGGGIKNIPVSPLLVVNTWQYIHTSRKNIIQTFEFRAERKHDEYLDPGYIFLSSATGQKLEPRSFSNSVRAAFLAAVDAGELTKEQRVWPHGFRHYCTATLLRKLQKRGIKNPETVARQVTRHGSEDAMQPYLVSLYEEAFHE